MRAQRTRAITFMPHLSHAHARAFAQFIRITCMGAREDKRTQTHSHGASHCSRSRNVHRVRKHTHTQIFATKTWACIIEWRACVCGCCTACTSSGHSAGLPTSLHVTCTSTRSTPQKYVAQHGPGNKTNASAQNRHSVCVCVAHKYPRTNCARQFRRE